MPKVWFITGSSRGFGRALATAALEGGDQVVATARRPEQLHDLVSDYGDRVRTMALDVTNAVAARAAVRETVDRFGSIDVVVNNAGYASSSAIEETPEAVFRAQLGVNLFGAVNVTKAALPFVRRQRRGHFIQFSSIGGRVGGTPGLAAYQTAKWGLEGFSEVLAAEVKPFGVKVTIIEPAAFRTDWAGSSMKVPAAGEDYEQTVGAMNHLHAASNGHQPGDPARAAQIIISIVNLDEPPRRLLLGAHAVDSAAEASRGRAAEADEWADLSRSADFPAGQPVQA